MEKWRINVQHIALEAFVSHIEDDRPAGGIHPNLSWFGPDDTVCRRDPSSILGVAGHIARFRNEAMIIRMKPPDLRCYRHHRRGANCQNLGPQSITKKMTT